jgi:hypothetical protein
MEMSRRFPLLLKAMASVVIVVILPAPNNCVDRYWAILTENARAKVDNRGVVNNGNFIRNSVFQ